MPKMKTKSGAKKRFKVTGSGKVKRNRAFKSHILTKMTTKRKRQLRGTDQLSPGVLIGSIDLSAGQLRLLVNAEGTTLSRLDVEPLILARQRWPLHRQAYSDRRRQGR